MCIIWDYRFQAWTAVKRPTFRFSPNFSWAGNLACKQLENYIYIVVTCWLQLQLLSNEYLASWEVHISSNMTSHLSHMQHEQLWILYKLFPLVAKPGNCCSIQHSMISPYIDLSAKKKVIFSQANSFIAYSRHHQFRSAFWSFSQMIHSNHPMCMCIWGLQGWGARPLFSQGWFLLLQQTDSQVRALACSAQN